MRAAIIDRAGALTTWCEESDLALSYETRARITEGMNKLHGLLALAVALSVATGCSRAERSPAPSGVAAAPAAPAGEMKVGAPVAAGRALVVTMDVGITVADVDQSRAAIRAEVERAGGYVADASSSGGPSERSVQMELRVPSDKVQGVRAALGRVGEITTDVEKVQDVTEERVDEAKSRPAADALMQRENAIKAVHLGLLVRIENILTPAQQDKLRTARESERCGPSTAKDGGRD